MKKNLKHILALFTAVALVLALTACDTLELLSPEHIDLNKSYSFCANMSFKSVSNEISATANFTRQSANVWHVAFAEPYALAGVELTYNRGELTSTFEDAEFSTPANGNSAVVQIIEAFENAISGDGRNITVGGRKDPFIRINSKAGSRGISYELALDKEERLPVSLTIAANSLTVNFSEAQTSRITPVISPNTPDGTRPDNIPEAWQIVPM